MRAQLAVIISILTLGTIPLGAGEAFADLVRRFEADMSSVRSFWSADYSSTALARRRAALERWQREVERNGAESFGSGDASRSIDESVDFHLLRSAIAERLDDLGRAEERAATAERLLPFAPEVHALEEARWRGASTPPSDAAARLARITERVGEAREALVADKKPDAPADASAAPLDDDAARTLIGALSELRNVLRTWAENRAAFEPDFDWWVKKPRAALDESLDKLGKTLEERRKKPAEGELRGEPIGRARLVDELRFAMIPYLPEELLDIARIELAWCLGEQLKASHELGFADRWKDALEHVKTLHVPPGEQAKLVVRQAEDVIRFLDERDLVTIPELCRETWRYRMLDANEQRNLPYAAYGGQVVLVASPTGEMDHESKLMSMRGNNVHFTRIVTPHELIPGHHLQGFASARHNTHRRAFRTPFYVEGWALYWEIRLWDLGYPRGPEDRIGMLFWRMHRAARIIVSLGFHLGEMTPQQMVDFLVGEVGHERDGATSEVRRYIGTGYGPLYQAAYMLGGLQLYALHRETVGAGKMTEREFHDRVLAENAIPIELIRARLLEHALGADWTATWRFYGDRIRERIDL